MDARTTTIERGFLASVVNFVTRYPGRSLALVLGAHLLIWTALPLLTAANLELDLAEDLALGKEWQLGYWKHPPLPWWLADLVFRLTGAIGSIHVLAPLAVGACFIGVYLLARDIAGPLQALIATLSLVGIHYYNYSSVKFAHDQMQLPFWAFCALFFYRGIARGRALDWMLAGAMLALAFWSKYAAFAFAVTLAAFLLIDPLARRTLRSRGPWLMAAAFCVVIAPNAWWLVQSGFLPMQYVSDRARGAVVWYQYLTYPGLWVLSQVFFILPALVLLGVTLFPRLAPARELPPSKAFGRRYVTALAFGPFAMVTLVALAGGRLPVALWGYPLWSFLPLAAILWFGPIVNAQRLRAFAAGTMIYFVLIPAIFVGAFIADQFVRHRPKATEFPGHALATQLTQAWHAATGTPLKYVAGTEFVVNNIAVYSPDRPHVVVHGRPHISPWIDMADLRKRGVIVAWEEQFYAAHIEEWRKTFGAEGEPTLLILPRETRRRGATPVRIRYWIVPPRE